MRLLRSLLSSVVKKPGGGNPEPVSAPIVFLTSVSEVMRVDGKARLYSDQASTRLRVLIPAQELSKTHPVILAPLDLYLSNPDQDLFRQARAVVIGKLSLGKVLNEQGLVDAFEMALARRRTSPRPFADVCDDYTAYLTGSGQALLKRFQRILGDHCRFIVPSRALAEALATFSAHGMDVIEDPWESPTQVRPQWAPDNRLRLLWFGNLGSVEAEWLAGTLRDVAAGLPDLALALHLVTGATRTEIAGAMAGPARAAHPDIHVTVRPWSLATTWAALAECDAVLLPQDPQWAWGRVKSHNRFVESLRAGRFVVASPIPSYRELESFGWVHDDLAAGLRWALQNPVEAHARIVSGQAYIANRFAPELVGERWRVCLEKPSSL